MTTLAFGIKPRLVRCGIVSPRADRRMAPPATWLAGVLGSKPPSFGGEEGVFFHEPAERLGCLRDSKTETIVRKVTDLSL